MIQELLNTAISGLVSGRISPNTFPQDVAWPAIRYTIVSSTPHPDLCGSDTVDSDDILVQIDCVSLGYSTTRQLRDRVIAELMLVEPKPIRLGLRETFDDMTRTHVASLDYTFYLSSPTGASFI